jgi:broad specificity phosphatase PhoE
MPSVLLVRHGQASFGAESYDVLSGRGREQAEIVADDLVARGVRAGRLISGGLNRQLDTAAPIAARVGLEIAVDPRWDEYHSDDVLTHHSDVGAREERAAGSPAPEISSRDFQSILEEALHGWIDAGDGGPAREPWPAFAARVEAALREAAGGLGSGETAIVSTSGGVIAALCVLLLGVPARTMVAFNRVSVNAAVTKIAVGRGGLTLVSFNEHGHLDHRGDGLLTYR